MANDWMGLTVDVLGTIGTARRRLLDVRITHYHKFLGDLETQRVAVEKILAGYEAGAWKADVREQQRQRFQSLVARLSEHGADIGSQEPTVLIQALKAYLNEFVRVGPHGPGQGEPEISFPEDAEESFGPDTHGSGEGEP